MLALYLLASHLVGDFVLQTRWQATGKFGFAAAATSLRARHAATYTLAFVPVAFAVASPDDALRFLFFLMGLHYLTDSHRFRSTLGDVIAWHGIHLRHRGLRFVAPPPNPWEPLPILIDQTLHIVQLAALGWLLT